MTTSARPFLPRLIGTIGATLLISASAALGAYFGYTVGATHHLALGLIFGGAALGGELLKPLAVAGTVDCFRNREFSRALACFALAFVCIVYSLAAELSLAAGSRGDTAAARQIASDAARTAAERRTRAEAELRTLPFARSAAELELTIARLKATPGANGCTGEPDGPVSRRVCSEVLALQAEAARAQRRAELEKVVSDPMLSTASGQPHVGSADPLAASLSVYLSAAGRTVPPHSIAPWLALIPVLFLELGSALSLIVVRSLSTGHPKTIGRTPPADSPAPPAARLPTAAALPLATEPTPNAADLSTNRPAQGSDTVRPSPADSRPDDDDAPRPPRGGRRLGTNIVELLKAQGGRIEGGQRGIAKALGISKSRVNELLAELAAAGQVNLTTDRQGTRVELATA